MWPPGVFNTPWLRGLDERARREIAGAGRLRSIAPDEVVYRAGDAGDAFFVVASGRVGLRATRRGDDRDTEVRAAAPGDVLGEEAVVGTPRRTTAVALAPSVLAEIPVHLFRRAAGRSGNAEAAEELERALWRSATRDLLGTLAFTRDLDPGDLDALLDAASHRRFERGQAVYRAGDPATELWLIADGMVQIQAEEGDRIHVRAYLTRGDFFGDVELDDGHCREATAVASGATTLLSVPAGVFAALARKHPDLIPRLRRFTGERHAAQDAVVAGPARHHTAHVFRDLYRLQIARSLLVIDLETCARCGHCAWSCADLHGASRLVRRGDKVVARVDDGGDDAGRIARQAAPRSLLLPNSCQHCERPACMIECPTGAIGKDTGGEVVIRDALCTGCGACAKACPWENIVMAPRPASSPRPGGGARGGADFPDLAVKCDLCREHDGPACVQACPTGSIFRVNPAEEIADVRDLLGGARRAQERGASSGAPRGDAALLAGSAIAAAGIGAAGLMAHAGGGARPGEGAALWAGAAAAAGIALLLLYAVPKRAARWLWMRPRRRGGAARGAGDAAPDAATRETGDAAPVRSRLRWHLSGHLATGFVTAGLALAHAPWPRSGRPTLGAALHLVFWATAAAGAFTAAAYRLAPRRLARIERTAALPEDFAVARAELLERLYREVSGRSDLVKKLVEKVLVPYVRSPLGPLALLASGRGLRAEERALRARIDAVLEGRGAERLAGLAELIRIAVELRALRAQRALLLALRAGLPVHIVTFGVAVALLALHAITAASGVR
ncbi:hypothetical protein SOCEGT47_040830 [Sorangium cellulosum]|uniref:Cyclic nucleotide-binding domain-containing protein n=1 Tax=Sorangium cellulosum TaxID=56 RepID=A0A4P2Q3H6_SORCE|nr:hypothetical protein SOCEGT47_040830 [Sorangium cellulosum]